MHIKSLALVDLEGSMAEQLLSKILWVQLVGLLMRKCWFYKQHEHPLGLLRVGK